MIRHGGLNTEGTERTEDTEAYYTQRLIRQREDRGIIGYHNFTFGAYILVDRD